MVKIPYLKFESAITAECLRFLIIHTTIEWFNKNNESI